VEKRCLSFGGHMKAHIVARLTLGVLFSYLFVGQGVGYTTGATGNKIDNTKSIQSVALSIAPDFAEKDIFNRRMIALYNLLGKVVILNFWATWCPPCRQETPDLQALQNSYKDALAVVGVSVFCSESATEQFYKDYKISYPMIYGSYDLMYKYGRVAAIPTTFLINKKGELVAKVVGSRTKAQYEEMIKPLLAQ
jgi:cytochrome c biogenesis protein CcmG/thiol:disulfide interchange protein DsbE